MQDLQIQPAQFAPPVPATLAVADVLQQVQLIQSVLKEVMVEGHHYGVIPGTEARDGDKPRAPVLLKAGAEKLCMVFRLSPTFAVRTTQLQNGHREERVTCTLTHIPSGSVVATADGSCSTMEGKYRYRNGKPQCPECGVDAIHKSKNDRPGWFCWSKKGGCGSNFGPNDARIASQKIGLTENKDIADVWNTVLKMAVKRALVAATLLATAASDMFIVEEDAHDGGHDVDEEERPKAKGKAPPQQQRQEAKRDPSEREQLISECVRLCKALGGDAQGISEILVAAGLEPGKRLPERNDEELRQAKAALHAEVELRKGGQPK